MDLSLTHKKNMGAGWNILASAKAAAGEKISRAQLFVNGFSKYDKSFSANSMAAGTRPAGPAR
jgi:hypothetical protein